MFAPRNTIGLGYGFACIPPPVLAPVFPFPAHTFLLCPHISDISQYRNFNLLSISYASPPRIRSRLTLGRRSLPRNPYAFGGMDSHHSFRYSYQHSHFCEVHRSLQNDFSPHRTLPYPTTYVVATASVSYFSPGNLRRRVSRPVSYYALFKWWLLLSQHPGCFRDPTSFST